MMMPFPFASFVRILLSLYANTCVIYIMCRSLEMERENNGNAVFLPGTLTPLLLIGGVLFRRALRCVATIYLF